MHRLPFSSSNLVDLLTTNFVCTEKYEPVSVKWTTERCAVCRWVEDWEENKMIICNRLPYGHFGFTELYSDCIIKHGVINIEFKLNFWICLQMSSSCASRMLRGKQSSRPHLLGVQSMWNTRYWERVLSLSCKRYYCRISSFYVFSLLALLMAYFWVLTVLSQGHI